MHILYFRFFVHLSIRKVTLYKIGKTETEFRIFCVFFVIKNSYLFPNFRSESMAETDLNKKLSALMGVTWGKYGLLAKSRSEVEDEIYLTRRKLTNVRRRALRNRCDTSYTMEPILDHISLPCHVASQIQNERSELSSISCECKQCFIDCPTHIQSFSKIIFFSLAQQGLRLRVFWKTLTSIHWSPIFWRARSFYTLIEYWETKINIDRIQFFQVLV